MTTPTPTSTATRVAAALPAAARHLAGLARGAVPQALAPRVVSIARWSPERAAEWSNAVGWQVGCNFTPSSASNQLEMWQADTFDLDTIDRELGWAASIGMNAARVFLHDLLWSDDPEGFLDRIDRFLGAADAHGIRTLFVLFDGVWNPDSALGPQPDPLPGVHNSTWVQGPGAAILSDPERWPTLRPYVDGVVGRFTHDSRVLGWDLFNEPDNPNAFSYASSEISHKSVATNGLLNLVFDWAQAIDPDQPLTAGLFVGVSGSASAVGELNRTMLSRSDVISFHCYSPRKRLIRAILRLGEYGRPLLCTEWLGRQLGSSADLIDVFRQFGTGAFCWGLVDGRTQTRLPWTTWLRPVPDDARWFHELFHQDGTAYDEAELALFRVATGVGRPTGGNAGGSVLDQDARESD